MTIFARLFKKIIWTFRSSLWAIPSVQSQILNRSFATITQPEQPRATVLLTVFAKGGQSARSKVSSNGKVSASEFMPTFCDVLRRNGFATVFVSSERELARALTSQQPAFIINIFGEDNFQINSPSMEALERQARATFNSSKSGLVLADKLASHRAFEAGGVKMPALIEKEGFVRLRHGSGLPVTSVQDANDSSWINDAHIQTEFIDTRIEFENRRFYTSVRLICVDGIVLHAYPRARDDRDENPSVHAKDIPLEPALIEYLHQSLVAERSNEFSLIAQQLFSVLGHGFFVHDLLIDRNDGSISVCESGFKFDDMAYWGHLAPISGEVPSQTPLFPVDAFAERSAQAFLRQCETVL